MRQKKLLHLLIVAFLCPIILYSLPPAPYGPRGEEKITLIKKEINEREKRSTLQAISYYEDLKENIRPFIPFTIVIADFLRPALCKKLTHTIIPNLSVVKSSYVSLNTQQIGDLALNMAAKTALYSLWYGKWNNRKIYKEVAQDIIQEKAIDNLRERMRYIFTGLNAQICFCYQEPVFELWEKYLWFFKYII